MEERFSRWILLVVLIDLALGGRDGRDLEMEGHPPATRSPSLPSLSLQLGMEEMEGRSPLLVSRPLIVHPALFVANRVR